MTAGGQFLHISPTLNRYFTNGFTAATEYTYARILLYGCQNRYLRSRRRYDALRGAASAGGRHPTGEGRREAGVLDSLPANVLPQGAWKPGRKVLGSGEPRRYRQAAHSTSSRRYRTQDSGTRKGSPRQATWGRDSPFHRRLPGNVVRGRSGAHRIGRSGGRLPATRHRRAPADSRSGARDDQGDGDHHAGSSSSRTPPRAPSTRNMGSSSRASGRRTTPTTGRTRSS